MKYIFFQKALEPKDWMLVAFTEATYKEWLNEEAWKDTSTLEGYLLDGQKGSERLLFDDTCKWHTKWRSTSLGWNHEVFKSQEEFIYAHFDLVI